MNLLRNRIVFDTLASKLKLDDSNPCFTEGFSVPICSGPFLFEYWFDSSVLVPIGKAFNFRVDKNHLLCDIEIFDPTYNSLNVSFDICCECTSHYVSKIVAVSVSMQYCLYQLITTATDKYRVYGPHVYRFEQNPPKSKHNIGNWVPDSIPLEKLLQRPNIISIEYIP